MKVYVVGSLKNENVPRLANRIRAEVGCNVFDDWYAPGPRADEYWQAYEKQAGRTYRQAIHGKASRNVVLFDQANLDSSTHCVLLMPAGKSGHLETGYMAYAKKAYVLFEKEPGPEDRWDQMYGLVLKNGGDVLFDEEELIQLLKKEFEQCQRFGG